jgi:hypothetical protein
VWVWGGAGGTYWQSVAPARLSQRCSRHPSAHVHAHPGLQAPHNPPAKDFSMGNTDRRTGNTWPSLCFANTVRVVRMTTCTAPHRTAPHRTARSRRACSRDHGAAPLPSTHALDKTRTQHRAAQTLQEGGGCVAVAWPNSCTVPAAHQRQENRALQPYVGWAHDFTSPHPQHSPTANIHTSIHNAHTHEKHTAHTPARTCTHSTHAHCVHVHTARTPPCAQTRTPCPVCMYFVM